MTQKSQTELNAADVTAHVIVGDINVHSFSCSATFAWTAMEGFSGEKPTYSREQSRDDRMRMSPCSLELQCADEQQNRSLVRDDGDGAAPETKPIARARVPAKRALL
ncbi:MAG: hypothetical protein ACREVI_10095 [Steroidobacteraceae bacterium]